MNTVLIVEDEKMIRQGIKAMIQRSNVKINTIIECSNGQMALEVLQTQKVDVMFTDIRMPKMDGIELVREMQKLENKPLTVAISGYDDFSYAVELMRMGVREYILKPVDRQKITEVLIKLEEEIRQTAETDIDIRNIGFRQLKHLMLNDDIPLGETELMIKQFEGQFFKGEYVICCCESIFTQMQQTRNYIYMEDNNKNGIFIIEKNSKHFLIKNELKNSYVGLSRDHLGLLELKMAYFEAKEARKRAFSTMNQIMEYVNISFENAAVEIDKNIMPQIAQMIGTDKIEAALKQIGFLFRDTRKQKYKVDSFEENIGILINAIQLTYQNVLQTEESELVKFRNIYGYSCIDALQEELTEWIISFNARINEQFEDYKNKQKVQQAISFIQENYGKDLNMAVVSNHISMNYSLFSYVFKQYTGKNFVNYLKDIRMIEAKRLLVETDMRVMEISQKIGYKNEKHFMKIFKSVCGVSPTEYRKNMQFTKNP